MGLVSHLRTVGEAGIASIDAKWSGTERTYLAERIRYRLDDPALMSKMAEASRARAAGEFDTDIIVPMYESYYEQVIANASQPV